VIPDTCSGCGYLYEVYTITHYSKKNPQGEGHLPRVSPMSFQSSSIVMIRLSRLGMITVKKKKVILCAVCRQTFVGGISRLTVPRLFPFQTKATEGMYVFTESTERREKKKLIESGSSASGCEVPNPGRRGRTQARSPQSGTTSTVPMCAPPHLHRHAYRRERRCCEWIAPTVNPAQCNKFFGVTSNSPTMMV